MLNNVLSGTVDKDAFDAGKEYCESILDSIDKDSYWPYKTGLFIREDLWNLLEKEGSTRYPGDLKKQNWFTIGVHTKLIKHLNNR